MSAPRHTFRKHEHLRRPAEFQRVYDRRRSASDVGLVVFACESDFAHTRIGLSVSKKHGNAVVRARLRRLLREAFRLSKHDLPTGLDLVLIPRVGTEPSLAALMASLTKLVPQTARRLARDAGPVP